MNLLGNLLHAPVTGNDAFDEDEYDYEEDLRLLGEEDEEHAQGIFRRIRETFGRRTDPDRVTLPEERRRHYTTMISSMTAVIAAASCVLVVMLMGTNAKQNELNVRNTQALAEKLSHLEESLNKVDVQVVNDRELAAGNTETYETLGNTVDTLKSNLTSYRDGNEITDEEIGTNLDGVIAQLDQITADLNAAKNADLNGNSELGEKLDSMSADSASKTANLTEELAAVHQDIKALMEETKKEGKEQYAELKGILAATDTSLSDLVSSKFDETGTLIAKTREQLSGDIAGVNTSMTTGFGNVSTSIDSVNTTLGSGMETVSTGVTNVGSAVQTVDANVANVGTAVQSVGNNVSNVQDSVNGVSRDVLNLQGNVTGLQGSLNDQFAQNQNMLSELSVAIHNVQGTVDSVGSRQDAQNEQLTKALEALQIANERIAGLEGQVATLQGKLSEGGTHTEHTQENTSESENTGSLEDHAEDSTGGSDGGSTTVAMSGLDPHEVSLNLIKAE